jgi:hypothetical protein
VVEQHLESGRRPGRHTDAVGDRVDRVACEQEARDFAVSFGGFVGLPYAQPWERT